jgi:hypothetical protein
VKRLSSRPWSVVLSLVLLSVSERASAAPPGEHTHDGFYLRFAGGPVVLMNIARNTEHEGERATLAYSGDSSRVSGEGLFGEVSAGGTPFAHVVLAGTLTGWLIPAPVLVVGGGPRFDLVGPFVFGMLAPTVDVFPNPYGGLHFGGGAGIATATVRIDDPSVRTLGGTGSGFTVHVGYDFWTSDEWSVGLFARGTFAVVGSQQAQNGISGREHDTLTFVTVAATVLYH